MNRIYTTICLFFFVTVAHTQNIGIGTTQPDASAALDISSSNKGLLIPRVDLAAAAPATPATGLMVFNTNAGVSGGAGLYINMGTAAAPRWIQLVPANSGSFIRNQSYTQTTSNFNITGNGVIGSSLQVGTSVAINKSGAPTAALDVNGDIKASGNFLMDVQYVRKDYTLNANTRLSWSIPCPAGYQVISGGGGHRDDNSAANDIKLSYSGPDPDAPTTKWRVLMNNTGSHSRAIIVYCNCGKVK